MGKAEVAVECFDLSSDFSCAVPRRNSARLPEIRPMIPASNKTQALLSDVSCDQNRFKIVEGYETAPSPVSFMRSERFEKVD